MLGGWARPYPSSAARSPAARVRSRRTWFRLYRLSGLRESGGCMARPQPFCNPDPWCATGPDRINRAHASYLSPSWAASSAGRAPPLHGSPARRAFPQDARDEATQGSAVCNPICNPHDPRRSHGRFCRCPQARVAPDVMRTLRTTILLHAPSVRRSCARGSRTKSTSVSAGADHVTMLAGTRLQNGQRTDALPAASYAVCI